METSQIITLSASLISLAGSIINSFFLVKNKAYRTEKGKSLATIEDIDKITKIAEGIKTELLRETNSINSKIQLSNQVRFSYKSEQIKSILKLHETHYLWLTGSLDLKALQDSTNNIETLRDFQSRLKRLLSDYSIAEANSKLLLTEDYPDFVQDVNQLGICAISLNHNLNRAIEKIKLLLSTYQNNPEDKTKEFDSFFDLTREAINRQYGGFSNLSSSFRKQANVILKSLHEN